MHSRSTTFLAVLTTVALLAGAQSAHAVAFAHNPAAGDARVAHNQSAASGRAAAASSSAQAHEGARHCAASSAARRERDGSRRARACGA